MISLATYYGLGLHAERLIAEDGASGPQHMAIAFKVCRIRCSICERRVSDLVGPTACLGYHGLLQSDPHRYQALSPFLLSPPLPSQPKVAAHRLVGQLGLCHALGIWCDGVLSLPMLARPMVLAAVLPPLPSSTTRRGQGPVQCDNGTTCRYASHLWPHIRCWNFAATYYGYPEATNVHIEEIRYCGYILRRTAVSDPKYGETAMVKLY